MSARKINVSKNIVITDRSFFFFKLRRHRKYLPKELHKRIAATWNFYQLYNTSSHLCIILEMSEKMCQVSAII